MGINPEPHAHLEKVDVLMTSARHRCEQQLINSLQCVDRNLWVVMSRPQLLHMLKTLQSKCCLALHTMLVLTACMPICIDNNDIRICVFVFASYSTVILTCFIDCSLNRHEMSCH